MEKFKSWESILGLVGIAFFQVLILSLISQKRREKVADWFSDGWRIFFLPLIFLTINLSLNLLVGNFYWQNFNRLVLYFGIPTVILYFAGQRKYPLGWIELLVILCLWMPVELRLILKGWKTGGISYPFVAYSAILYSLIVFTGLRKLDFQLSWRTKKSDWGFAAVIYAVSLLIIAPIAYYIGFVAPELNPTVIKYPLVAPVIFWMFLFAPALAEEIIFRGVIQNVLMDRFRPIIGLGFSATIFGLAHFNNRFTVNGIDWGYPNWTYVIFATIAGFGYGQVYHKTKSLGVTAVLHASIDFTWWLFLKGGR
mgnify:CR=1 FL=1